MEKFRRSLRVYVQTRDGPLLLCDWYRGQPRPGFASLTVSFTVRRQLTPAPHECTLNVHGLSSDTREKIIKAYEEAESMAWETRKELQAGRVRVDAGYDDDIANLFIGDIAPDGVTSEPTHPGHVMKIRALDGRIAWKGRYVHRANSNNVDIKTIRQVYAASGDYMLGKDTDAAFEKNFPGMVKKKLGFAGYESGYALFGESRSGNKQLCAELGIVPVVQDGEIRYISADAALQDKAVLLSMQDKGVLLDASAQGFGRYRIQTLLEHRLRPGRQVLLADRHGRPIGGGVYRVDAMVASGGNKSRSNYIEGDVVPTGFAAGSNT